MAERRMFAKTVIDSDAFLDMPLSTQALYFHLSMRGDDDGFVNNPKKIVRSIGATDDELKLLLAKGFIIAFESGVVVIKHWKIHNYIRGDRYKPTAYTEEFDALEVKPNKAYTLGTGSTDTAGTPTVDQVDTQVRLGESSLGKSSQGEGKRMRFTPPAVSEVEAYAEERGASIDANRFCDYYAAQGWKLSNGNAMKDWKAAVRNWISNDKKKRGATDAGEPSEYAGAF